MKKQTGMTPAALRAALAGEIENFLAASTPGGIEAQKAAGQRELVQSAKLPRRGTIESDQGETANRAELESLGFVFGAILDPLFVACTLPSGWRIEATSHHMRSHIFDAQGRERMSVFYKAAFYGRDAFLTVNSRYHITTWRAASPDVPETDTRDIEEYHMALRCHVVLDYDGTPLYVSGSFAMSDYAVDDRYEMECKTWLAANYPDWQNPFAYWNDEKESNQ